MGRAQGQQTAESSRGVGGARLRGPYKWTPERIERTLTDFLAGRPDWPTREEFEAAGHAALYDAVKRHGGASHWAAATGCVMGPMQDRSPYPLSVALREAVDLILDHGRLPNTMRLRALGHSRLAWLVESAGGAGAFVAQHGLVEHPPRRAHRS